MPLRSYIGGMEESVEKQIERTLHLRELAAAARARSHEAIAQSRQAQRAAKAACRRAERNREYAGRVSARALRIAQLRAQLAPVHVPADTHER